MKTSVYTTLISASVLSVILTGLGLLGSRFLMRMIQTSDNIFNLGDLYLRIYIGGFVFLFLYNVATGIFTSLGDSKTPLYFLIGSSLGNIFLDYWFVAGLHWGVAGVAWATFIAQGIACELALITRVKRLRQIKTDKKAEYFSADMLKRIARIAIPSILQQSFVSIGNIFVQGLINSFGSSVIAGYSAAIKLNTFTITSFTTLGNGISSFTAQNIGAGKVDRVKQGMVLRKHLPERNVSMKKKKQQGSCESCLYYEYDEDYECYVCEVNLDEDEMARFMEDRFYDCPYYRLGDEYMIVRKQM